MTDSFLIRTARSREEEAPAIAIVRSREGVRDLDIDERALEEAWLNARLPSIMEAMKVAKMTPNGM